jgi:hypothetical protein
MSVVETQQADKATQHAGDTVAKHQELTAAVCDVGLQTMQECNDWRMEQYISCEGCVSESNT